MKKSVPLLFIILTIMFLTSNVICSGLLLYREKSENGKYKLNVVTSMKYKTEVFGDPFGDFLEDAEDGWMVNEQGVKGEYKYLGYNYEEDRRLIQRRYALRLLGFVRRQNEEIATLRYCYARNDSKKRFSRYHIQMT